MDHNFSNSTYISDKDTSKPSTILVHKPKKLPYLLYLGYSSTPALGTIAK